MGKRVVGVIVGASVALACGPSYQALYEGDARFEHCYALEETTATMQARGDCWRDWTLRYTFGQTRDRVEYAAARYRALSRAPQAPTDEAMMAAAPGEGRAMSIAAPAPTSAFAPPPKTLDARDDAGAPEEQLPGYSDGGPPAVAILHEEKESAPDPEAVPAGECVSHCRAAWNACKDKCVGPCVACNGDYKRCMRGCFK